MAAAPGRSRCVTCGKDNKATLRCGGCLQEYCFNHSLDHRQELNIKLDEIEVTRDLFRQTLTQQTAEPEQHALIQQINDWERNSIKQIRRTAEEARQTLLQHTSGHIQQIEVDLSQLTDQLRQSRKENDFFETDLHHWNEELKRLSKELTQPTNINLRQDTTPFINKISVGVRTATSSSVPGIAVNAKWTQIGVTVAGGNRGGIGFNQLSNLYGLYVDEDQTVFVAEWSNHRITEWKNGATSGRVVAGGNRQGIRTDQLFGPTNVIVDKKNDSLIISDYTNSRIVRWSRQKGTCGEIIISSIGCWGLAMDNDGDLYVSDYNKHEVRRWKMGETNGTVVVGGNGAGNRRDQLSNPTCLFVDQDHSVYVSDLSNHRVMKWTKGAKEGAVVAGGQGQGNSLTQLSNPYRVVVDQLGAVYVADYGNHRVMRWPKGATQGSVVVGGNRQGSGANQVSSPVGLSFDRQGNLYVPIMVIIEYKSSISNQIRMHSCVEP